MPDTPGEIQNPYLNLEQLRAKLGGRSRSSITRDVKAERLPAPARLGQTLYWKEADIDAALERAMTQTETHDATT